MKGTAAMKLVVMSLSDHFLCSLQNLFAPHCYLLKALQNAKDGPISTILILFFLFFPMYESFILFFGAGGGIFCQITSHVNPV